MERFVRDDLIFIVLREGEATVQLLLEPGSLPNFAEIALTLRQNNHLENSASISGIVQERPAKMQNAAMATGNVEIIVKEITLLNDPPSLSFNPTHSPLPDEDFRLIDRFIDLRRSDLHGNLVMRALGNRLIRSYMESLGIYYPT